MEQWNKSYNQTIMEREEFGKQSAAAIAKHQKSIDDIYTYFQETMKTTTHTLIQVEWIAYVEKYFSELYRIMINRYKSHGQKSAEIFAMANALTKIPTFESHQKMFKDRVNTLLEAIFGKQIDLSIFLNPDEPSSEFEYEIDEEDLLYLLVLYATYDLDDAEAFINKNYRSVSYEYYTLIRFGAEALIKKNRIKNMTEGDLNTRFDVVFGLKQREAEIVFKKAEDEFHIIKSIFEDFVKDPLTSENAYRLSCECMKLLSDYQQALFDFRSKWMSENGITSEELNAIIKRHQESLKKND